MTDGTEKPRELSSWKEIANFLDVSVRTAQKWEAEKGLPIRRRSGLAGRVSCDEQELACWKERLEESQPWWLRVNFRAYYALILPILLAAVMLHDVWSHHHFLRERIPSSYRLERHELVVLDADGVELWRKFFSGAAISSGKGLSRHGVSPLVSFQDVNRDGRTEVLFLYRPADFGRDVLYCYSADGQDLWEFKPPLSGSPEREFRTTVTNITFNADASLRPNSDQRSKPLLVLTCSLPAHQGRLHAIDGSGAADEVFRHDGHLDGLDMADVDQDGIVEVLVGGVDNRTQRADLHITHVRQAPSKEAELEAEILFPRTETNRILAEENAVARLAGREGYVQVSTLEWFDNEPFEVCYVLDKKLRPEPSFTDPFKSLRRRLQAEGRLPPKTEEVELKELRDSVQVTWRPRPLRLPDQ